VKRTDGFEERKRKLTEKKKRNFSLKKAKNQPPIGSAEKGRKNVGKRRGGGDSTSQETRKRGGKRPLLEK